MKKFKGVHLPIKWIPQGWAITIFPFCFYSTDKWLLELTHTHETIHIRQQLECSIVGLGLYLLLSLIFHEWLWTIPIIFLWLWIYLINWLILIPKYKGQAVWNTMFEREGLTQKGNWFYPDERSWFAFFNFLRL